MKNKWNIDIGYNPMTQAEFLPVYNFLLQRSGPLNPFYVSLPQYRVPQNSVFSTAIQDSTNPLYMYPVSAVSAGSTSMLVRARRLDVTGSIPAIDTILDYFFKYSSLKGVPLLKFFLLILPIIL